MVKKEVGAAVGKEVSQQLVGKLDPIARELSSLRQGIESARLPAAGAPRPRVPVRVSQQSR